MAHEPEVEQALLEIKEDLLETVWYWHDNGLKPDDVEPRATSWKPVVRSILRQLLEEQAISWTPEIQELLGPRDLPALPALPAKEDG